MASAARRSLPAGISRAIGAGWERPRHRKDECDKHSFPGQFFDKKGGVAPSPAPYDPDSRAHQGEFPRRTAGIALTVLAQAVAKGGVGLVASEKRGRRA